MTFCPNENTIIIEYTKEQKQALAQLRKAWNKCMKTLRVFNQYGTLQFYPKDEIRHIGCEDGDVDQDDVWFEDLNIQVGEYSDDHHEVLFTEKGRKKYMDSRYENI